MPSGKSNTTKQKQRKCKDCNQSVKHARITRRCVPCTVKKDRESKRKVMERGAKRASEKQKAETLKRKKGIQNGKKKKITTSLKRTGKTTKKRASSVKKKKPKYKREATLKKKCWRLWSKKIREEASDWRGNIICYTCGDTRPLAQMQAGHFIHGKLDFDERNIKPQCVKCNMYLSGNLGNYAERLIRENGLDWIEQLKNDAHKHTGYKEIELQEIFNNLK